ncbi:MAG: hypothetical protein AABY32_00235, partial [Nanoarchaeota archaeon]
AVDFGTVGKLIVAILIIALLWIIFVNLGDFLYGTGNKAACQNWVARNSVAYLKEFAGNAEESSPCVTTQETIKSISSKNDLYEKLAQNMYNCWDQYGQGEANFYSNFDWGSSNTHCRICSEIKFDNEVKKQIKEIDVDDFESYLSAYNPPNSKQTYAEFFIKADRAKIDFGDNIKIPINNDFYTMFVVNKRSQCSLGIRECILSVVEKALTTVGIGFLGTKTPFIGGSIARAAAKSPWGALAVVSVGTGAFLLADGSILYPSLWLTYSQDYKTIDRCDSIYYNPEKKPLSFVNK